VQQEQEKSFARRQVLGTLLQHGFLPQRKRELMPIALSKVLQFRYRSGSAEVNPMIWLRRSFGRVPVLGRRLWTADGPTMRDNPAYDRVFALQHDGRWPMPSRSVRYKMSLG
jgi:hypothetical protein